MRKFVSFIYRVIYPIKIGMLEVNMRSLEVFLRTFLLIDKYGLKKTTEIAQYLRNLKIGQEVDDNPLTEFIYFSQLVDNYNDKVSSSHEYDGLKIDCNLKRFRNALAHGLAFYLAPSPPYAEMLLLHFIKSKNNTTTNKLTVGFKEIMTICWLNKKINWTQGEYKKVVKACRIIEKTRP